MAQPLQPGYFGNQDLLILPAIRNSTRYHTPYAFGRPCGWPVPYSPMQQYLVLIIFTGMYRCIQYIYCMVRYYYTTLKPHPLMGAGASSHNGT